MMRLYNVIATILILLLGVRATYTDIRWHKVFNKDLTIFLIAGIAMQGTYFIMLGTGSLFRYFINWVLCLLFSYLFYIFHIWAAGDAKLFSLVALLVPYKIYGALDLELFPAFYMLGCIFSIALVCVTIESLTLFIKELTQTGLIGFKVSKPIISVNAIVSWLMGYSIILLFNDFLYKKGYSYIYQNHYLLILVNVLVITLALTLANSFKLRLAILIVAVTARLTIMIIQKCCESFISVETIILVSFMILLRKFTSRYNYRPISTDNIQAGMILAKVTLIDMIPSKVKELPHYTDETTRYRLTTAEADAVHRWKNSKYGKDQVVIVRHIPFAPFIFAGSVLFIIFKTAMGEF